MSENKEKCNTEIHLFVLWNNARNKESEIIKELAANFQILEVFEIEWNKKLFKQNLERFYCEKIRRKIKETGTGKFLVITVKDNSPEYKYEQTLKGYELVNSKVLFLKQQFRKLTGGGYKIHATNNIQEADKNLIFLLNMSYNEYFEYAKDKIFDGNYKTIKKEPVGAGKNFNNIYEIFKLLNSSCQYVILRGFDNLADESDIDLLVDDFETVKYLLNAEVVHKKQPYRTQVKTKAANKTVLLDLCYIGDDYYCEKWEEDILNNRIYDERGFYTPNSNDLFYTLIYHSLIHKKKLYTKYNKLLEQLLKKNLNISPDNYEEPYDLYDKLLYEYMNKNDYYFIKPYDRKVKFNKLNIKKIEWINLLSSKYNFKNIYTYKINKSPSSGFEFFFTADFEDKKVFLKCGTGHFFAKKEFHVYEYLYKQNKTYFPSPIMYRNLAENKMFLCIEYIEGKSLSKELLETMTQEEINKTFNSLVDIADILYINKFIHRDINNSNIIIQKDGTAKLIDFQHLIGKNFKESSDNISSPRLLRGTNKKLRPHNFVWDDMFSIYHILSNFDKTKILNYEEKMGKLKSRIGKQRYYLCDNKFPLRAYFNLKSLIIYKSINIILKPFRKYIK